MPDRRQANVENVADCFLPSAIVATIVCELRVLDQQTVPAAKQQTHMHCVLTYFFQLVH